MSNTPKTGESNLKTYAMLKKFILLFALMVSLFGSAQDKPLSYSEVIQVEGKNQAEIYGGLRQWVATSYANGKYVTQMEDAASGVIILKALFPFKKGGLYVSYSGKVDYLLKLQSKDGRFRVEMSQITHSVNKGNYEGSNLGLLTTSLDSGTRGFSKGPNNKIWKELKEKSAEHFAEIVTSLKSLNNFNAEAEEDW